MLQEEIEELNLIYGNRFQYKPPNVCEVDLQVKFIACHLKYYLPSDYPNSAPGVECSIGGYIDTTSTKFLHEQALTMLRMPMLSFLTGEAINFLSGNSQKFTRFETERITQTPFSREAFFLWLDKFNKEREVIEDPNRPLTGREMFERGVVKSTS